MNDDETGTTITDGLQAITQAKQRTSGTKSKLMVTPDMIERGELTLAAISFICSGANLTLEAQAIWPWFTPEAPYTKLDTPIENLAKAGALLAAEIDRVLKGGEISVKGFLRPDIQAAQEAKGDFDEVFRIIRAGIKPSAVPQVVKDVLSAELHQRQQKLVAMQKEVVEIAQFLKAAGYKELVEVKE